MIVTRMFQTEMKSSIPGSKLRHKYIKVINDCGTPELREIGVEDIQECIDSYRDMVDLNYILDKCTNGHTELLSRMSPEDIACMLGVKNIGGQYIDISDMPTSMIEAYDAIEKAKKSYEGLDPEKKKNYNDFRAFLNGIEQISEENKDIVKEEISNE